MAEDPTTSAPIETAAPIAPTLPGVPVVGYQRGLGAQRGICAGFLLFINALSAVPAWVILLTIFIILVSLWHIRPDADTQTMMKEVLAALLLSMRVGKQNPA